MKLALLGDIHGNADALAAALAGVRREGGECLVLTGDYVRYYTQPADVLALIASWERVMIRGNHEEMLGRARHDPVALERITRRYGHGVRVALETLSDEEVDSLVGLPETIRVELGGVHILVAHGTPWDARQYLYPDAAASAWEPFRDVDADVVVLGHTHYPMVRHAHGIIVVNPGSVGQPRDRLLGAAWTLFDTEAMTCQLFRESYDVTSVCVAAARFDPDLPYLREVLGQP